jgi:hypothetical protein
MRIVSLRVGLRIILIISALSDVKKNLMNRLTSMLKNKGIGYPCSVCGLHYKNKKDAKRCYNWCSAHDSCNLKITKYSLERQKGDEKHGN